MMAEQVSMAAQAAQVVLATIVIIAVFTVMGATLYFHSKKHAFPKQTIILLQWLIKVLVYLFAAASFSISGLRIINTFLK
jgi:hypothetical protein